MLTELGELADPPKRELAYGKDIDSVNVLEECGDFLWYYVLYAWLSGVSMRQLQRWAWEFEVTEKNSADLADLSKVTRMLALSAVFLIAEDHSPLNSIERETVMQGTLWLLLSALATQGYSLEQCMEANDAKLEKRTGKRFDAGRVLNRDVSAERQILEDHAQGQQSQDAG